MIRDLAVEALFVSPLQPSQHPDWAAVERAVEAMVLLHGSCGCAELVAQEFGDHPEQAARRMGWCLTRIPAPTPASV